jgi:hypothetical protein
MNDQKIKHATAQPAPQARPFALVRNPIVFVPYLLSMPLALLVPEDVLNRWHGAKVWFEFVASFVPIVANYAHRSPFPQVTGFYFSIVVIPMALCFFWGAFKIPNVVDEEKKKRIQARIGPLYYVFAGFVALGMIFLAYFALAINPGYDFNLMPINRSRVALTLCGPLFAGGLAGICAGGGVNLAKTLILKRGG